jgi:hypothetical protein
VVIQLRRATSLMLFLLAPVLLGLLPKAQAVSPPPDGGYALGNTAEGTNALFSLTIGASNTGLGVNALRSVTTGSQNTAVGGNALKNNTASQNTAVGFQALFNNTTGGFNTATGIAALGDNTAGSGNTASGSETLARNTVGNDNTATGFHALFRNTQGSENTAIGDGALSGNTTAGGNTAIGEDALASNTTGNSNLALGPAAGFHATTGSNNVYIGVGMLGVAGESNACYIASIFGQTSASGAAVSINSSGKLGTMTSSRRFKDDIKPMGNASAALFALKPVSFRYNRDIDPTGTSQLGLVAEDVEKVNSDLIVRDKEGKPYSVRYDQVNAMLLNEFLKEHRKGQEQGATIARQRRDFEAAIARQQKEIKALTATVKEQAVQIQKVSAQFEVSQPAAQTVLNDQ